MSWLSKALGLSKNPASAANPYLSQIPGVGQQYYSPYVQQGQEAGSQLRGEYQKQLKPAEFLSSLQSQYEPSDQYKFNQEELMRGMRSLTGAGGYRESPEAAKQYGQRARQLLSEDEQRYLQNALGIYQQGIGGLQDVYGKGASASSALADYLGSALGQQAGMAYRGAAQDMGRNRDLLSLISQSLGGGAGFAMQPSGSLFGRKLWG